MSHARPHLTTHTRSKGHSALAGVAYRLGLRLFDKRQGVWHDYRHRSDGNEVVAAFTLAPVDAPSWATDPAQVWAAAETAEKRKDSQIAHDFRIPLPLGLSEDAAIGMARAMAQHLVDDLDTIVSVGVHRDNAVDAMGIAKPLGKVGLHAHLYLPTRRLALTDSPVTDSETAAGEAGEGAWAFTEKLKVLAHKASASACIERMNSQWAALANVYAADAGLVPDFTHLSYARLGLAKLPQVTLGAAVTAMERRGVATWKADPLRAPAPVSAASSARVIERLVAKRAATEQENRRAWLTPADPILAPTQPGAVRLEARAPTISPDLAARFWAELDAKPELPQPPVEQRERLDGWLRRLERALRMVVKLGRALIDLAERHRREDGARATFAVELHAQRVARQEARTAASAWVDSHPWHLRMARAVGGSAAKPTALVALQEAVASHDASVQQFKREVAAAEARARRLDKEKEALVEEQLVAVSTIDEAVTRLRAASPLYMPVLLSVSDATHVLPLTEAAARAETDAVDLPEGVVMRSAEQVPALKAAGPRMH